jgi:hypothetical protein
MWCLDDSGHLNHRTTKAAYQRRILVLRIGNDHIVVRGEYQVSDLPLATNDLPLPLTAQNEAFSVQEQPPVGDNQVL